MDDPLRAMPKCPQRKFEWASQTTARNFNCSMYALCTVQWMYTVQIYLKIFVQKGPHSTNVSHIKTINNFLKTQFSWLNMNVNIHSSKHLKVFFCKSCNRGIEEYHWIKVVSIGSIGRLNEIRFFRWSDEMIKVRSELLRDSRSAQVSFDLC